MIQSKKKNKKKISNKQCILKNINYKKKYLYTIKRITDST